MSQRVPMRQNMEWKSPSLFLVARIPIPVYMTMEDAEAGGGDIWVLEDSVMDGVSEPEPLVPVTSVRSVFDETWIFRTATAGYSSC